MTIHVLHITNAYPCDDIPEYGVFVKEQIESLDSGTINSEVLFINGRSQGKLAYLSAIFRARSALRNCDVVHCHHAYSFIVALLAGAARRKPVVLSFLNDWKREVKDLRFEWLKSFVCLLSVRLSSAVIFKSPIPDELRSSTKVVNLPNGVDGDFFRIQSRAEAKSVLGLPDDVIHLLFVSSKNKYREQKRYDIFEEVVDRVRVLRPGQKFSEFVMVGQSRQLVPTIFSACDVHLLTSDYEGSPNSVKESLCCGTPVVTRDVGNVRDMLDSVMGACVVRSDDPDVLAEEVIRMLDSQPEPSAVRSSFLEKGVTKQIIADRLASLYLELKSAWGTRH